MLINIMIMKAAGVRPRVNPDTLYTLTLIQIQTDTDIQIQIQIVEKIER